MIARPMQQPGNDPERLTSIILHGNTLTICKCGKRCECRSSLPKSRSIEIANSKNALPLVTSALAVAERNFDIAITVDRIGPTPRQAFQRRIELDQRFARCRKFTDNIALVNISLLGITAEPCCRVAWHRLG